MTTLEKKKLKQPISHEFNLENGARFADFNGWEMPTFYTSIIEEYKATRANIGLFDVSHMGRWWVTGKDSMEFLNHLITNDLEKLKIGRGLYSPMCSEEAGIIDDLIIYKTSSDRFLLVNNAGNHEIDSKWYFEQLEKFKSGKAEVKFEDITESTGQIAIQGPQAKAAVDKILSFEEPLKYFSFKEINVINLEQAEELVIAATGYTGETGYELYGPADALMRIWGTLIEDHEALACGLGSRDLLRLEAGYPLHGNDIDLNSSPFEAGLSWTVKLGKEDFIGKANVERLEKKLAGLVLPKGEKYLPRQGTKVLDEGGKEIGIVTSGNFSPLLDRGIALAYVETGLENKAKLVLRGKEVEAIISEAWFYRNIKGKETNEILSKNS